MGLGDAARTVAAQTLLFEEFIVREARAGRFAPELVEAEQPMLVHGHCHQKAFGLMDGVLSALRLIPGAQVVDDREFVLRHGRQLRLRGGAPRGVDAHGRAVAAAGGARRAATPSSWPTAPVAATRSPTVHLGRRCMWRRCWRFTWLIDRRRRLRDAQRDRHRPVVDQFHLHVGAELAGLHARVALARQAQHGLVERAAQRRLARRPRNSAGCRPTCRRPA